MRWNRAAGLGLAAVLMLAACGTLEIQVETPPPADRTGVPGDPVPAGDNLAAPTALGTTLASEPAPEPAATEEPAAPRTHPLQGLLYSTLDGVYRVDGSGQPEEVGAGEFGVPSPDGRYLAVLEHGEPHGTLRILDQQTGTDVIAVGDRGRLCCLTWWPARPGVLLYGALPASVEIGPGLSGNLAAVGVDGTDYGVLDPDTDLGPWGIAPSPDGESVAYGFGDTGAIYTWGEGPTAFDPRAYAHEWGKSIKLGSPSWSPDGSRIAYVVSSPPEGTYELAVMVFDLASRQATKVYGYEPAGRGGWPAPPAWSPDGEWLAFEVWAQDLSADGIWVARTDGSEARPLSDGASPLWSPDGQHVVFLHSPNPQDLPGVWLAEAGTWAAQPAELPVNARLLGWQ